MPKPLPAKTTDVYLDVRTELMTMLVDIAHLANMSDSPLKSAPLNDAVKRIHGRTFQFISEELEFVLEDDYLPSAEVAIYRNSPTYKPGDTKRLYTRWVAIYTFLLRRIGEYKRSDLPVDAVEKLIEKYGVHLVGTHEQICKSGLPTHNK